MDGSLLISDRVISALRENGAHACRYTCAREDRRRRGGYTRLSIHREVPRYQLLSIYNRVSLQKCIRNLYTTDYSKIKEKASKNSLEPLCKE